MNSWKIRIYNNVRMRFLPMRKILVLLLLCYPQFAADNSWTVCNVSDTEQSIDRMRFVSDKVGWACSFFAGVFRTDDGGHSWSKLISNRHHDHIYSVWFTSQDRGWAMLLRSVSDVPEDSEAILTQLQKSVGGIKIISPLHRQGRFQDFSLVSSPNPSLQ
jgi:hypothetical protein